MVFFVKVRKSQKHYFFDMITKQFLNMDFDIENPKSKLQIISILILQLLNIQNSHSGKKISIT